MLPFSDRKPPGVGRGRGRGREDGAPGRQVKGIGRGFEEGGAKGPGGGRGRSGPGGKPGGNRGKSSYIIINCKYCTITFAPSILLFQIRPERGYYYYIYAFIFT